MMSKVDKLFIYALGSHRVRPCLTARIKGYFYVACSASLFADVDDGLGGIGANYDSIEEAVACTPRPVVIRILTSGIGEIRLH